MKYNFDKYIERRNTNCEKWDSLEKEFGKADLQPFWVADMDFAAPPEILQALHKKIDEGALGYPIIPDSLLESIKSWEKTRHGWEFEKEAITWAPGVVAGLSFALMAITKPGDGVIVQTPIYPPFYRTIEEAGRIIKANPLKYENGRFVMDIEGLEKLVTPTCRTLLFCSPHNPTARVWSKEELKALCDLAKRKDMIIVSDEIHQDIVYTNAKHTCLPSISSDISARTITFIAPSKTFNIAGLKASIAIIPNESLRARYISIVERFHLNSVNTLGAVAMEAAYSQCGDWLDQLVVYLEKNRDYTEKFIYERMPKAKLDHPEGTYMFWIDFREYGFNSETLEQFLVHEAGVALNKGTSFGAEGDGFARLNIGTTFAQLKAGLDSIANALDKREGR